MWQIGHMALIMSRSREISCSQPPVGSGLGYVVPPLWFTLWKHPLALVQAESPQRETASDRLTEATTRLGEAEAALQRVNEATAAVEARRMALERRRRELAERGSRLEVRRLESVRQREILAAALVPPETTVAATAALAEAEQLVVERRTAVAAGEEEAMRLLATEQTVFEALRQVESRLTRLKAEAEAFAALLATAPEPGADPPILSALNVAAGCSRTTPARTCQPMRSPGNPPYRGREGAPRISRRPDTARGGSCRGERSRRRGTAR